MPDTIIEQINNLSSYQKTDIFCLSPGAAAGAAHLMNWRRRISMFMLKLLFPSLLYL